LAIRRWILGACAVIAGAGALWWFTGAGDDFATLAAAGKPALARVKSDPSQGQQHLNPGQAYAYASRFPTSGPHDPNWVRAGLYSQSQPPTLLVHALEHGNIVIYFERPGDDALKTLRGWSERFNGQWDGVVVAPMAGLGGRIVLTAWTRTLDLERFDAAAAAAFIDAYRGRGPENPVR
jgi:hypothetical protein